MIAIDSSTLIAYLKGDVARDTDILHTRLLDGAKIALCPLVITEMTSVLLDKNAYALLGKLQMLEFKDGFWERAGMLRNQLIRKKLKARVADAIIAQSSIDYATALLTRDRDFRHYATLGGLILV